ncbi:MAG TPA: hypothetical protein VIY48_00795, partial [Candidatus Paceibacterota bacterium]
RSLWQTVKALPYSDGPSTSRWGYLIAVHTTCLCLAGLVTVFCVVYYKTGGRPVDAIFAGIFAGVITSFMGVVVGFTTNTMNLKHTLAANLQAQASGSPDAGAVAPTPATTAGTTTEPPS